MACTICDQKPANCDCTAEERRQYGEIEDLECEVSALKERLKSENAVAVSRQKIIERLQSENAKQAKQIADAAYLLHGVQVNTPAFEAHRILCGMPPGVK